MNKILVEVMLPAAQKTYDVYLPLELTIREITQLLVKMFADLNEGDYMPAPINLLCDGQSGDVLDISKSPAELGVTNGVRLLLI